MVVACPADEMERDNLEYNKLVKELIKVGTLVHKYAVARH